MVTGRLIGSPKQHYSHLSRAECRLEIVLLRQSGHTQAGIGPHHVMTSLGSNWLGKIIIGLHHCILHCSRAQIAITMFSFLTWNDRNDNVNLMTAGGQLSGVGPITPLSVARREWWDMCGDLVTPSSFIMSHFGRISCNSNLPFNNKISPLSF